MIPWLTAVALGAPQRHEVTSWVSRNIAPSSKVRVNLNTRNVPRVHVTAMPVNGSKWLVNADGQPKRPEPIGPAVRAWDVTAADKGQRPNPNQADTYYSRQVNLPPLPPGVYLLDFGGGDKPSWAVVNVTDLAVIVKRSPKRTLVWVTDFKTGAVVPGADVSAFRRDGRLVARATTGRDGAVLVPMVPGEETFVVRRGRDLAGVPTSQTDPNGQLKAHFQTDRPVYRPGQRISFKAILRGTLDRDYAVVAGKPCTVQLRDPKDNPLDEASFTSSAMGTVAGSFDIPQEGMTGPYTLVLQTGKDSAYQTVSVAQYRKPEFKVDARPTSKRYLAGEGVTFEVDAGYFFGAPVPQAAVHYVARRSPLALGGGDPTDRWFYSGDGNLYAHDAYASDAVVGDDTVYTDAQGKATIHLKSDPGAGDSTISIVCDVTDGSRRVVQASGSVPVYGASLRLGLSSSQVYATLGSSIPITVRAVNLDGRPAVATVEIALKRPYFDEKKGEEREREVTRTSVRLPPSGRFTIGLPAKEAGEMRVYATAQDTTKHTARANLSVYVAGNFEPSRKEKEAPSIAVMLDKRVYEAGQTAKAFVRTNNPTLPVLLVAEGGDIWDYRVLSSTRATPTWSVATSNRLSPNAYVAAEQWVKGQLVSANVILPVPDRTKALKVMTTPDKRVYRPGEKAHFGVRTTDGTGKPVSAEVALAVVDEAIYAVSPDNTADLYGLYWGFRGNAVSMQVSAPEELSGGAFQRVNTLAPLRQRFEDTALWAPSVLTDANGQATLDFEMPGNLTSWRATARAVTMDTSVGTGSATVLANRPVMLRLATPREMVQGDRLTVVGTVDNRSDKDRDFDVSLVSQGASLDGLAKQRLHVAARSEGKVQWTLRTDAMPADGLARLTGQVSPSEGNDPDAADALEVAFPVVPNGLPERLLAGGTVEREATATLDLPVDRIEPASVVTVEVRAGIRPVMQEVAQGVLQSPRYGSLGAADQLEVAASPGVRDDARPVKESLALLSRTQLPDGWGRWESAPADPIVTARVASAIASAGKSGIRVFDGLVSAAREAVVARYNATNLWEHRALLAVSSALLADKRGKDLVQEVLTRGNSMSPYARLRVVEALLALDRPAEAETLVRQVLKDAPAGTNETFVPAGEGIEWSATDVETTAEALYVLATQNAEANVQAALARWLLSPEHGWRSSDEDAAVVRALAAYLKRHPEARRLGEVTLEVNGKRVQATPSRVAEAASATVPRDLLKSGTNTIIVRRSGEGEALYTVESRVFRPVGDESTGGIRVLRRYEVKNAGGLWKELDRPVQPGEPVRCTVVAWGDDVRDAMWVVEPIPAGFEFTQDESTGEEFQEVRDGAVVHYLTNSGTPQTFRYYLRAESEGEVVALPATAEYLSRPKLRGHSEPLRMTVRGAP